MSVITFLLFSDFIFCTNNRSIRHFIATHVICDTVEQTDQQNLPNLGLINL